MEKVYLCDNEHCLLCSDRLFDFQQKIYTHPKLVKVKMNISDKKRIVSDFEEDKFCS